MAKSSKITFVALASALLMLWACNNQKPAAPATVEGHYTYEHAFDYSIEGYHLDVHETGTMDFAADGSALDSARQVYKATTEEGDEIVYSFDYVSPSRWQLDGDTLHFAGIKDKFRMEVVECSCDNAEAQELAQKIIGIIGNSIDYEYKFNMDTLTAEKMQWSFTYRDGHSDTWEFFRRTENENGQKMRKN